MEYIRSHWRGEQSLFWSFWVNLAALRLLILLVEQFTHPPFTNQSMAAIVATFLYTLIFQLIVCVWQVRGIIKACDRYMASIGFYSRVLLAQIGMVASIFLTLFFVLGAFQSLFEDPSAMYKNRYKKGPPLLGEYSLTIVDDGRRIHMEGDFNIGLTKDLRALLEKHSNIKGVVLNSSGGRVTEGRGVAKLIKKYGLDTFVFDVCKSACMTAFIGGTVRNIGVNGRLGFHQFTMDSIQKTPYLDPVEEQKVDLAFYTAQKLDPEFLKKIFQTSHTDIWFPSTEELLAAGVVHNIRVAR